MTRHRSSRALTTLIATVGPACREAPRLRLLLDAGVDVFRVNTAHGTREDHDDVVSTIRRVGREAGRPVGILVDLAGPKIRLGELVGDAVRCVEGETVYFTRGGRAGDATELVANHEGLIDELDIGDRVMLADGTVSLKVTAKRDDRAECRVTGGGVVRSRQGVNLPGVKLSLAAMTEADRDNAAWAARCGVDFVGLSFVRSPDEIAELEALLRGLGSSALVVAKIEKREALEQLDGIVQAAGAVMVARGDLGVEIDVARTPVAQRQIIETARRHHKPAIVATQMLDSMQHSRHPTRAEVSDVASAIYYGADACMLSGETAVGEYPRETVEMMNRIMIATESSMRDADDRLPPPGGPPAADVHPITFAVVQGATGIARRLEARLVVVVSRSGATARIVSKQQELVPIVGVSDNESTLQQMCLMRGITPLAGAPVADATALREFIDARGREQGVLASGDRVVFITGSDVVPHGHNLITVHEVGTNGP